jgi:hypothetical protein
MADWSQPSQLAVLAKFYEHARSNPELVPDSTFVENIVKALWPTNCWAFVEEAFAIIAPGCALRPHLTRILIQYPIEAMIAGGLEKPEEVIAQGVSFATKSNPYVEPSPEGRQWLLLEWPRLEQMAIEVFREKWHELFSPEA